MPTDHHVLVMLVVIGCLAVAPYLCMVLLWARYKKLLNRHASLKEMHHQRAVELDRLRAPDQHSFMTEVSGRSA